MAEKKTPQDHKDADGPRDVDIDGLTVTVDSRLMNDWRFVRMLRSADSDTLAIVDVVDRVFGDQMPAIEAHLADEDGFVDAEKVGDFLRQALEAAAPNS